MVLGKLLGGGTVKAVGDIIDDLYTSEEEKNEAKIALEKLQTKLKEKQLDIIEEKSNDVTCIDSLDINENVRNALGNINYIATDFGDYEYNSNIDIGSDWNLYLSFIGPAYDWANGKSIYEIYASYENIYENSNFC